MASTRTALEKVNKLPDALRGDLHDRIDLEKENIIDALFELAKGAWYEAPHVDDNGKPYIARIYKKLPDKEVAQYLLNQVIGKPRENIAIQGRVNFIMDS